MEASEIVVDVEAAHLVRQTKRRREIHLSMQQKLEAFWGKPNEAENFTIFRAPYNIRQSKKNLFEPYVVSIGPFHRGNTSLRAMEEMKWRFLREFLSRGDRINLGLCITEMELLEEKTRRCYSETVDLDSAGFIEMMLLDGCFVLEYFLNWIEGRSSYILEVGWNAAFILSDLLLLENQIPFFVVEKLCEIGEPRVDTRNFVNNIAAMMTRGPTNNSHIPDLPSAIHHLVHLCYLCAVPNPEKPVILSSKSFHLFRNKVCHDPFEFQKLYMPPSMCMVGSNSGSRSLPIRYLGTRSGSTVVIPCATELQDAGVKFKSKSNPRHMFDISFKHGVLEIPRLTITDDSKPLFVNLIALEQCMLRDIESHLTSFASLLDSLVNTQKDVMILQQCGIIENCLSSEKELTLFFNQLREGAILMEDHFLAELFVEVNRYCESSWNRQRAKLIRDYFSSPWAVISLIAAVVLLVLTSVQSFFAVYAYFRPPS